MSQQPQKTKSASDRSLTAFSYPLFLEYQTARGKPDTFSKFIFAAISSAYRENRAFHLLTKKFVIRPLSQNFKIARVTEQAVHPRTREPRHQSLRPSGRPNLFRPEPHAVITKTHDAHRRAFCRPRPFPKQGPPIPPTTRGKNVPTQRTIGSLPGSPTSAAVALVGVVKTPSR